VPPVRLAARLQTNNEDLADTIFLVTSIYNSSHGYRKSTVIGIIGRFSSSQLTPSSA
jgi:hypothetical protein